LFLADFQHFSRVSQPPQYRFTRERSLVRAQPCPSEKPSKPWVSGNRSVLGLGERGEGVAAAVRGQEIGQELEQGPVLLAAGRGRGDRAGRRARRRTHGGSARGLVRRRSSARRVLLSGGGSRAGCVTSKPAGGSGRDARSRSSGPR